jgi:hypothetical protein
MNYKNATSIFTKAVIASVLMSGGVVLHLLSYPSESRICKKNITNLHLIECFKGLDSFVSGMFICGIVLFLCGLGMIFKIYFSDVTLRHQLKRFTLWYLACALPIVSLGLVPVHICLLWCLTVYFLTPLIILSIIIYLILIHLLLLTSRIKYKTVRIGICVVVTITLLCVFLAPSV